MKGAISFILTLAFFNCRISDRREQCRKKTKKSKRAQKIRKRRMKETSSERIKRRPSKRRLLFRRNLLCLLLNTYQTSPEAARMQPASSGRLVEGGELMVKT